MTVVQCYKMESLSNKYRRFPKIGLGTFSIPREILGEIIPLAIDLGYTLFDTAYKYKNEDTIGETLTNSKCSREDVLLQTKLNPELLIGNLRYFRLNGISPHTACRKACNRLRTNYLDVLMLHSPFPGYEKRLEALMSLKKEGSVRLVGICNIGLNQLIHLERMNLLPDVVQVEVHPYFSNKPIVDFCHAHDIILEVRSPFAHGDAMSDWLKEGVLQDIAKRNNATIPQVILSWIITQGIIALPRTSNKDHLRENIDSQNLKLTEEEMESINSLNQDKSYGVVSSR